MIPPREDLETSLLSAVPETCVILVSYHGAADTAICLASLQSSVVPVEIVVVDTTPGDPELARVLEQHPKAHLIDAGENLGFGRGNNVGIRWALKNTACQYLFLLNNDASVFPDSIARLQAYLYAHSELSILTPRIAYRDDPQKLWYGGGDVDWRRASVFTPGFNQSATAPVAMVERDVTFASGCALFMRRSAMEVVRGFDSRFFMYEEDVEWCLRATGKGFSIRYVPSVLILHRAQGGSNSEGEENRTDFWSVKNPSLPFYAFHITRNRLFNLFLHAHGRNRIKALAFFPVYVARRAGPFLLGGRPDAVVAMLKGAADFWRNRKATAIDELSQGEASIAGPDQTQLFTIRN